MRHNTKTVERCQTTSKSVRRSRPKSSIRAAGFQFPAPVMGVPAPATLTLPNISGIAPKLINRKSVESTTNIAIALIDKGLACDDDANQADNPALFVEQVFSRWIEEKTSHIKLFNPVFAISDSLQALGDCDNDDAPKIAVGIMFSQTSHVYSLKAKIEHLEKTVPGLGQTALHNLYSWLGRTMLAVTPDLVFSLVQHQYWYGNDDEKGFYEEMDAMGEEIEDGSCPVTLSMFEEDFPKNVYMPSRLIEQAQLETLKAHTDKFVAETAELLLAQPNREKWDNESRPSYMSDLGSGNDCVEIALELDWEERGSDITNQVCDDWVNDIYNSGVSTEMFAVFQDEQTSAGLSKIVDSLEQYFNVLEWLERAVTALSTKSAQ